MMEMQTLNSVLDALADTPSEAANMKARSELLSAVQAQIRGWKLPQEAAATRIGIARPRLNCLMRGKLGKFSLDALVNLPPGLYWKSVLLKQLRNQGDWIWCPRIWVLL